MKNTTTTTTTTTPEILKTSIELLTDYIKSIEKYQHSSLHYENNPVIDIKKNIRHLNLMRIAEEYRLKQ